MRRLPSRSLARLLVALLLFAPLASASGILGLGDFMETGHLPRSDEGPTSIAYSWDPGAAKNIRDILDDAKLELERAGRHYRDLREAGDSTLVFGSRTQVVSYRQEDYDRTRDLRHDMVRALRAAREALLYVQSLGVDTIDYVGRGEILVAWARIRGEMLGLESLVPELHRQGHSYAAPADELLGKERLHLSGLPEILRRGGPYTHAPAPRFQGAAPERMTALREQIREGIDWIRRAGKEAAPGAYRLDDHLAFKSAVRVSTRLELELVARIAELDAMWMEQSLGSDRLFDWSQICSELYYLVERGQGIWYRSFLRVTPQGPAQVSAPFLGPGLDSLLVGPQADS